MRIQNGDRLCGHGNVKGRRDLLEILEAGLEASDPYHNTKRLVRMEGASLIVGAPEFEPPGTPNPGPQVFDLTRLGRILVVGAGKGVQRIAKALEEVLGERLSGGHVIDKHGHPIVLERIGVTLGGHPVPDEGCVEGCRKILETCRGLGEHDLVFTIAANGISSLLTLPVPGVSLEDVRRTTYVMQIERGAYTVDLNPVRNHLDRLKGGRISALLQPATAVHLLAYDPAGPAYRPDGHDGFMHRNAFLHTLPDWSTFQDAVAMLHKWNAWDAVPESVRAHLTRADPSHETIKARAFADMHYRIYGILPRRIGLGPVAQERALALGYRPHTLCDWLVAEAGHAGTILANVAKSVERSGVPFEPPCAVFSTGELLVTVGEETGVGGRNQEYAAAAALAIEGCPHIVIGGVDTDGTDGPGGQFVAGGWEIPTLAGGIVDGFTVQEAGTRGVDLREAIRRHDTTPALWALENGIVASPGVSLCDLTVLLIMGRRPLA